MHQEKNCIVRAEPRKQLNQSTKPITLIADKVKEKKHSERET